MGYFVMDSDFLRDWELANPHTPWWDMSGWFYYSILWFYKLGWRAAVIAGGFVFGLIVIGQYHRFVKGLKKSIRS